MATLKKGTDTSGIPLPLPLFEMREIGTLTADDGSVFRIVVGLDEALIAKLKERSLDATDEALQKSTQDRKRFGEGSYEEWYAKDRNPYALVAGDGGLAALAWYGKGSAPEEASLPPEYADTVAFRSYDPYRGKRLMRPFGEFVIAEHDAAFPDTKLWLETDTDNEAGIGLFSKLGFAKVADSKGGARIVMTRN